MFIRQINHQIAFIFLVISTSCLSTGCRTYLGYNSTYTVRVDENQGASDEVVSPTGLRLTSVGKNFGYRLVVEGFTLEPQDIQTVEIREHVYYIMLVDSRHTSGLQPLGFGGVIVRTLFSSFDLLLVGSSWNYMETPPSWICQAQYVPPISFLNVFSFPPYYFLKRETQSKGRINEFTNHSAPPVISYSSQKTLKLAQSGLVTLSSGDKTLIYDLSLNPTFDLSPLLIGKASVQVTVQHKGLSQILNIQ